MHAITINIRARGTLEHLPATATGVWRSKGVGLRPLACCDYGSESAVAWIFVCCECRVSSGREGSATGRSLVQRSPTDCGVSECYREASIMRRRWPTGGCCVTAHTHTHTHTHSTLISVFKGPSNPKALRSVPTAHTMPLLKVAPRKILREQQTTNTL